MTEDGVDEAAHPLLGEQRPCRQSAIKDRTKERESRNFRIELPLAFPMSARLPVAPAHPKAAIPFPARPGQPRPVALPTRKDPLLVDCHPTALAAQPGLPSESNFRFRCYLTRSMPASPRQYPAPHIDAAAIRASASSRPNAASVASIPGLTVEPVSAARNGCAT